MAPVRPTRTARLLLASVRVYQTFISTWMPSACKFYPSCSRYALEAIEIHGARRGSWLVFCRLLRCRPFSPGGIDPVPELGRDGRAPEPLEGPADFARFQP